MSIKSAIEKKFKVKGKNLEDAINKAEISSGGIPVLDLSEAKLPKVGDLETETVVFDSAGETESPCLVIDYPDPPFAYRKDSKSELCDSEYYYPMATATISIPKCEKEENPNGNSIAIKENTNGLILTEAEGVNLILIKPDAELYRIDNNPK